jgi:hypothetical protein
MGKWKIDYIFRHNNAFGSGGEEGEESERES